jgi:hypothetical protein
VHENKKPPGHINNADQQTAWKVKIKFGIRGVGYHNNDPG